MKDKRDVPLHRQKQIQDMTTDFAMTAVEVAYKLGVSAHTASDYMRELRQLMYIASYRRAGTRWAAAYKWGAGIDKAKPKSVRQLPTKSEMPRRADRDMDMNPAQLNALGDWMFQARERGALVAA